MKRAISSLSVSILLAMSVVGCDNSAKVPTADKSTETKSANTASPITIGYSDWPGFVAWQVAIEKGWLKDAGLNICLLYTSPSPRD